MNEFFSQYQWSCFFFREWYMKWSNPFINYWLTMTDACYLCHITFSATLVISYHVLSVCSEFQWSCYYDCFKVLSSLGQAVKYRVADMVWVWWLVCNPGCLQHTWWKWHFSFVWSHWFGWRSCVCDYIVLSRQYENKRPDRQYTRYILLVILAYDWPKPVTWTLAMV